MDISGNNPGAPGYDGIINLPSKALDEFPLGIARSDEEGRFTYANRETLRLAGFADWRGRSITEVFHGKALDEVRRKIRERFDYSVGNQYVVDLNRADGRAIPVHIMAFPETGPSGEVIGSFAIIRDLSRESTRDRMRLAIEGETGATEMWDDVVKALRGLLDFDRVSVHEMSRDGSHLRTIFEWIPPGDEVPQKSFRWWKIHPSIDSFFSTKQIFPIPDLKAWYGETSERYDAMMRSKPVLAFLDLGYVSCVSYPVWNDARRTASVVLFRKGLRPFTKDEQDLLRELPLGEAANAAVRRASEHYYRFQLELLKMIATAPTNGSIADSIVRRIADQYGWHQVSLFRAGLRREEISLIAQQPESDLALPQDCKLSSSVGILGRVLSEHRTQIVLRGEGGWPAGTDLLPWDAAKVASLMCVPIGEKGRWVLCVADKRLEAFAAEEQDDLERIAEQFSILLDRRLEQRYRAEIFNRANDAIVRTDDAGLILEVNQAATDLLTGDSDAVLVGRNMADLVDSSDEQTEVVRTASSFDNRIVAMRRCRSDGTSNHSAPVSVLLSCASLSADLGGKVFVASDMTLADRLEQLERAQKAYREVATQVKTPMSLAMEWLRRTTTSDVAVRDVMAKTLAQLRKAELTLDRMMLSEWSREHKRHDVLIRVDDIVESVEAELPADERSQLDVRELGHEVDLRVDAYQIRYCLLTIISYLQRLVPGNNPQVSLDVEADADHVRIAISAQVGDGRKDYATSSRFGETIAALELGEDTLVRLVEANGGTFARNAVESGQRAHFSLRFPTV